MRYVSGYGPESEEGKEVKHRVWKELTICREGLRPNKRKVVFDLFVYKGRRNPN